MISPSAGASTCRDWRGALSFAVRQIDHVVHPSAGQPFPAQSSAAGRSFLFGLPFSSSSALVERGGYEAAACLPMVVRTNRPIDVGSMPTRPDVGMYSFDPCSSDPVSNVQSSKLAPPDIHE